jgi:hypothetical protein
MQRPINLQELDIVIYHQGCQDGLTSAHLFKHECLIKYNKRVFLIPASHKDPKKLDEYMDLFKNKNIIMVDIATPNMIDIKNVSNKFYVLDHHKSSMEDCSKHEFCYFDMNKCGCTLAWEYIYGDREVNKFIKCLEVNDLWLWEKNTIEEAEAVCEGYEKLFEMIRFDNISLKTLDEYDYEVDNSYFWEFNRIMLDPSRIFDIISLGKQVILTKQNEMLKVFETLKPIKVKTPLSENIYTIILTKCKWEMINKLGNYCMRNLNIDFFVGITSLTTMSFRSIDEKTDCTTVGAKGHRNAAGMSYLNVDDHFIIIE